MQTEDRINIEIFKVVTRAIAESNNLEIMAKHLAQLLVGALEIKGATIFATNVETKELEDLGSFGLSIRYMSKGPIHINRSIKSVEKQKAVVVRDVKTPTCWSIPRMRSRKASGRSFPFLLISVAG